MKYKRNSQLQEKLQGNNKVAVTCVLCSTMYIIHDPSSNINEGWNNSGIKYPKTQPLSSSLVISIIGGIHCYVSIGQA